MPKPNRIGKNLVQQDELDKAAAKEARRQALQARKIDPFKVVFDTQGNPTLPTKLSGVIDLMYITEQKRHEIQKQVDRLKTIEAACANQLINSIDLEDKRGDMGVLARCEIEPVRVPTPEDWEKIHGFIRKHNAFELLHKRLSMEAVRDRWENGKEVPGVGAVTVKKVHLYKLKMKGG